MGVSDPGALLDSVRTLLDRLGTQALGDHDKIGQLLDKLPKPGDLPPVSPLDALKPFRPPDWWSLLVFVLVEIQDKIGDPEIWVGVQQPPGWARMITLNYSPNAVAQQPPPPAVLTVGLALGDSQQGTLNQGIWINLADKIDKQPGSGTVQLTLSGQGSGSWQYSFGGGPSPLMPTGAANSSVQATIAWRPWALPDIPLIRLSDGSPPDRPPLTASVTLKGSAPVYQIDLGVGPVSAGLDLGNSVLATLASSMLQVTPVHYSPRVELIQNQPPMFTLGS
jgi:hypothetical protein